MALMQAVPVAAAKRASALAPAKALGGVPLSVKPRARAVKLAAAPASASLQQNTVQARRGARSAAQQRARAGRPRTDSHTVGCAGRADRARQRDARDARHRRQRVGRTGARRAARAPAAGLAPPLRPR
jgi:hypothetical protein